MEPLSMPLNKYPPLPSDNPLLEQMCVYKLTHKENGKAYIGKTLKVLRDRLAAHHFFKNNGAVHDFKVEILHRGASKEDLIYVERYCIIKHGTLIPSGFNTMLNADDVKRVGRAIRFTHTERKQIRKQILLNKSAMEIIERHKPVYGSMNAVIRAALLSLDKT